MRRMQCPKCGSDNYCSTLLGWIGGRNPNYVSCCDCGFNGKGWQFENAAMSRFERLKVWILTWLNGILLRRAIRKFGKLKGRGLYSESGIQVVRYMDE